MFSKIIKSIFSFDKNDADMTVKDDKSEIYAKKDTVVKPATTTEIDVKKDEIVAAIPTKSKSATKTPEKSVKKEAIRAKTEEKTAATKVEKTKKTAETEVKSIEKNEKKAAAAKANVETIKPEKKAEKTQTKAIDTKPEKLNDKKITAQQTKNQTEKTNKDKQNTAINMTKKTQPESVEHKNTTPPAAAKIAPAPAPATPSTGGAKRKVIVDYKNVPDEVLMALSEKYPHGYNRGVIKFTNAKNEVVSAVPIELGETSYLVKVSTQLQKMVDDIDLDDDDTFVPPTLEKEVSVGAVNDLDEFDKSDEDEDKPKKIKAKGRVGSADDLEYGFDVNHNSHNHHDDTDEDYDDEDYDN